MDSSSFTPPARRSLTDAELQQALGNAQADEAGITAAMELLESQTQLRDIEKMEFASWVMQMEQIGSPESLRAVENAKRAQQGLEPLPAVPDAVAPVTPPIDDVVTHLNNLYANSVNENSVSENSVQAATEPVLEPNQPEPQTETPVEPLTEAFAEPAVEAPAEPFQFFQNQTQDEPVAVDEPVTQDPVFEDASPEVTDEKPELDDFDRLLAADTVVGAEDELTALEEELLAEPETDEEELVVLESDPGVEFVSSSAVEELKLESEPKLSRRSKSISQFWAWLGLSGSVLPLGLAWFLNAIGISFTQALLAVFAGTLASALVISVGALAGKRSGLPTLVLSRAAFGVRGNAVPGVVLTLVRFFWAVGIIAAILILATDYFAVENLTAVNEYDSNTFILLAVVLAVVIGATVLAVFGGRVLFRAQQVVGLIGLVAVVSLAVAAGGAISFQTILSQPSTNNSVVLAVAIAIFAVSGLTWASAGSDYARKLAIKTRGAAVVGWAVLALSIVPTAIAGLGLALLGSLTTPNTPIESFSFDALIWSQGALISTYAALLAPWLGYLLIGSAVLSVVVALAMALYSSNLSLHSIGVKIKPAIAQPLLAILFLAVAGYLLIRLGEAGLWYNLSGYALMIAVPVAAWAGIFAADILIRRIAYHEVSLSRAYGFYKSFNLVNLIGWAIATAVGFGLVRSELVEFSWTGYLAEQLGSVDFWQSSSAGIVIALAIGLLLPVIFGIPRIKRQEAEVLAIESRRDDLKNIFDLA